MNFSVIIPVYNVEKYLAFCLDSIIPAVETQDEIILVQGQSLDQSRNISKMYQQRYSFIRSIEQNGTGLSNARNCGIRSAKGSYVLFIDSDDFVNTNTLKRLLKKIRIQDISADIIMTDFYRYYETSQRVQPIIQIGKECYKGLDALSQLSKGRQCFWNVWRNIYKIDFLLKNKLIFCENRYGEDIDYMTRVFAFFPVLLMEDAPFYYYRMDRENSLMAVASYIRLQDTIKVLQEGIARLRAIRESWADALTAGLQLEYILNLALLQELHSEEKDRAISLFDSYRTVLLPTSDNFVRILSGWIGIIGPQRASICLAAAKRMKRKLEHRKP